MTDGAAIIGCSSTLDGADRIALLRLGGCSLLQRNAATNLL